MNTLRMRLSFMLSGVSTTGLKREDGQTLAEYALILALIAAVVVAVVATLGTSISSLFTTITSKI